MQLIEFRIDRLTLCIFKTYYSIMPESHELEPNTFFIQVTGAGLPEVDGLFVPSTAPPAESESGTVSSLGYWNGRMAWDRADGKVRAKPRIVVLEHL